MSLLEESLSSAAQKVLTQCLKTRATTEAQKIISMAPLHAQKKLETFARPHEKPLPVSDILAEAEEIFEYRTRCDHPRFFGFIPGPGSDSSWLGEVLNTAYNTHAGSWLQSSGPTTIERTLLSWMAQDLIGFPSTGGGCFVSGGSMANLSAMITARDQRLTFEQRAAAVIYTSEQTHSSVGKGIRIIGFHESQLRKIPCDEGFRMDTAALQRVIREDKAAGKIPFLLVGNAGATNTGSVDPFEELAEIAKSEGMWLHADGAYGASAVLSTSRRHVLNGLKHCDSVSWDGHKWLFQTYGCGMILLRDRRELLKTFTTSAEYIQDAIEMDDTQPNMWNYTPELTRPSRAMKLWFSLRAQGLDKIDQDVTHAFKLAEAAQAALEKSPNWEILSPAQMAIICFRFRPAGVPEDQLDELNKKISLIAIENNLCAPLTTRLRGVLVLRICSINPDLTEKQMEDIVTGLQEIGESLLK